MLHFELLSTELRFILRLYTLAGKLQSIWMLVRMVP